MPRLFAQLAAAALALIWLLPFVLSDHKLPVGTFWQEWCTAALLLVAVTAGLLRAGRVQVLAVPKVASAFVGLAAVVALQYAIGLLQLSANAVLPLLYLLLALLACTLGGTLRHSGELDRAGVWIALATVLGGLFNVWVQIAQLQGVGGDLPWVSAITPGTRPYGNINQYNHLATYQGMALAALIYLRVAGQVSRPMAAPGVLMLMTGLVLSGQRSALIYALLPLLVVALGWRKLTVMQRRELLMWSAVLPLLFFALNVALPWLAPANTGAVTPIDALQTKSFYSERANLWQHSWTMFMAHPLLGVGFDQYWPHFFRQLDAGIGSLAPSNPHNVIAALMSETGLIGLLVTGVPLLLWLWRSRLAAASGAQWMLLAQLLMIGVHAQLEYPLWYTYFLVVFALCLGANDTRWWVLRLQGPRLLVVPLALLAAALLLNIAQRYQDFRQRLWTMPHAGIVGLLHVKPAPADTFASLSQDWFWGRDVMFWCPDLQEVSRYDIAAKLAFNERALDIAPSSSILTRQVLLRALNGQADEANRLLARARQIYPGRQPLIEATVQEAARKWPERFQVTAE